MDRSSAVSQEDGVGGGGDGELEGGGDGEVEGGGDGELEGGGGAGGGGGGGPSHTRMELASLLGKESQQSYSPGPNSRDQPLKLCS